MLRRILIFLKPNFLYKYQINKIRRNSIHGYYNIRISEILERMKKYHKITYYSIESFDEMYVIEKHFISNKRKNDIITGMKIIVAILIFTIVEIIILKLLSSITL